MAGLLNKLRAMDAAPKKPEPAKPLAGCGEVYQKTYPFPKSLFRGLKPLSGQLLQDVFGGEFPQQVSPEDILFFDTETTGLSGGAGTVAFQLGLGWFTPGGFVVEQLLMHDYPEEPRMLEMLRARMQRFSVICTFNGKTFDLPLIKSRFVMNRISGDAIPLCHADVLYPARRIWKLRLKRCNLGTLESALLGVQREDDLPGALVPQTYFQYLKDGNFAPLQGVLDHNRQDIVSLAQLFYFLVSAVEQPETISEEQDLFSLAVSMEKRGQRDRAVHLYRLCAKGSYRGQALGALSRSEKRDGRPEAAAALLETMLREGRDPLFALEELAKLWEHQFRDPERALGYTRQALILLSEPKLKAVDTVQEKKNALQYRYHRLRRKLENRTPQE